MYRYFDFSNDEYQFQELGNLRIKWKKVPSREAINAIAEAHQYYDFLKTMIVGRVQSWSHPVNEREHWFTPTPLTLSARAGAISSCISVGSSIIECAMRAHAENRNIVELMKRKSEQRTFGTVIHAWRNDSLYSSEIEDVIIDIEKVHSKRNNIHLYASFGRNWENVIEEETETLKTIEKLFDFFVNLDPIQPKI